MQIDEIILEIQKTLKSSKDVDTDILRLRKAINDISSRKTQPIDLVLWVPIEDVQPNNYNPNSVAKKEMGLLYHSIKKDGYTQPIVTIYDKDKKKYVIIDGFHRYFVGREKKDIAEATGGRLPIVVLKKSINERMAATVRHNRARGEHKISGMGRLVFNMLENGWKDEDICNEIGLEPDELLKLKHITGFSKLFKDAKYNYAWETDDMIKIRKSNGNKIT